MRVLVALGGNAMTGPDGQVRPRDQIGAAAVAAGAVAELAAAGHDVAVTHGNGPQVGNLLVKNELAASVVPPVPLDWCVAQTQATLGFVLVDALDAAFARGGVARRSAALVTRVLVRSDDAGFDEPTKPIGRYLSQDAALPLVEHGETWQDRGEKGWRRVVASPEPVQVLDADAIRVLVDAGFVVVAGGGGGVPHVAEPDGTLRGVEAVVDKDLGAALLGVAVAADVLVIGTDVEAAVLRYGEPDAEALGRTTVTQARAYAREGHFGAGSMGPKVEAACRFVESGGRAAVITDLAHLVPAASGEAGTVVVPD